MRRYFQNFVISIVSILVTLFLCEGIIRLFYPLIKNYDTEMWKYAVKGKISAKNPCHFHMNKPGVYFKNLYGVEVKINSKGLRDYDYTFSKPANTYRILVLGDSITFGWGVELKDTYSKCLERKLNQAGLGAKFEVINTGVGNYNLKAEIEFLKREGLKYQPDMIVLGYFINDAEVLKPAKDYFLNTHSYFYVWVWSKLNLLKAKLFRNMNYINYYLSLYKDNSETKKNFEKNVVELKEIVTRKKIPLIVVLIPELHNLREYPFLKIHNYVKDLFKNFEVIDILPYLDKNKPPYFYWVSREDPHPNKIVHKIIGEVLYKKIMRYFKEFSNYTLERDSKIIY